MGTSFDEIYCMNQLIRSDVRFSEISINDFYLLMWKYLQFSISDFKYDCLKNLTNYTPYSQTIYNFICNGIDNSFHLDPAPTQEDIKFYIYSQIGENIPVDIDVYTYDNINQIITLNSIPEDGTELTIISYDIGSFNEELDLDEKRILAYGMNIPWLQEQINELNLVRFTVYGGSMKMHSQAEHINRLDNQIKSEVNYINNLINLYSYKTQHNNFDKLGGRYYAGTD